MTREPLWTPSDEDIAAAPLTHFMTVAGERAGQVFGDYDALHAWSISDPATFWNLVWDFCNVLGEKGERTLIDADQMPGAAFFPDARINFAENLLSRRG